MIFVIIMTIILGYLVNAFLYICFMRSEEGEEEGDLRFWFVLLFIPWLLFVVFLLSMIPKTIRVLIDEGKRVFDKRRK